LSFGATSSEAESAELDFTAFANKIICSPYVDNPARLKRSQRYSGESRGIASAEIGPIGPILFPEKFESLSLLRSKWTASDLARENAQSQNRK
jgi:hypothetical protein